MGRQLIGDWLGPCAWLLPVMLWGLELGISAALGAEPPSPVVRLEPTSPSVAEYCAPSGTLTLASEGKDEEHREFPVSLSEATPLHLGTAGPWSVLVDVPGCWAPEEALQLSDAPTEITVSLWPAGLISGKLAPARNLQLPDSLEIHLTPAPSDVQRKRPPSTTVSCPITERDFSCPVPADRFDLRLAAGDFIPEYRWDIEVAPGRRADLGEVALVRGASVAGWVVTQGELSVQPRVELVPEVVGDNATAIGDRLAQRTVRGEVNERGFFHFRGLGLGSYRLSVQAPGFGSAQKAPILIEELREYLLDDPLVLEPRAELAIHVDPPLAPDLRPWTIRVEREIPLSSMFRVLAEEQADEDGVWKKADLEAGHYLVRIQDADGSTHFKQELHIAPGIRPLVVELPLVPVRGTLHAGETPLSRTIWFQQINGPRIRLVANEEGRFAGVLPSEGLWTVRLEPHQGRGQQLIPEEVAVVRGQGEPWAEVDIALPATHLVGEVRNTNGRPIEGALVSISRHPRTAAQVYTKSDGSFEVHGLPEGEYLARAEAEGNRESDLRAVELSATDDGTASIELIVRERRLLQGKVVLDGAPVAGALIRFQVPRSPIESAVYASPEGRFTLALPAWVDNVDVIVLSPGLPTKLARVEVPPVGEDLPPLTLAPLAGDLVVRIPPNRQPLYIRSDGSLVPIWSLLVPGGQFRELDPATGTLHLPLEPASYTICPSPEVSRHCQGGYLAPGGRLELGLVQTEARDPSRRRSL